ncbi:MAG: D-alanyl-D-alanine carboxypeptidase/D-alanyl-D-alanine-endopeptidase [Bacteroidaceae bacterium]|nr:D-alanyl-D-alanine carboxypeptidase/D-alanyl-D-alanine-endopeptidase [Bacteroidaceae bacterium]
MHRKISLLTTTLLLCLSLTAQVQPFTTEPVEPRWEYSIRAALDRFLPELDAAYYNTGIQVYDLTTDSVLWAYHAGKVMRPASCQKLLTTISALDLLGSSHTVSTRAYYTGSIVDSVLQGNIYVVGGFDPTYTYDDLCGLAARIRALGINSIKGRIMGDTSFKDTLRIGNGWCWDDKPSVFHPYLSPLLFDRGRLSPQSDKYPTDIFFNPAEHFLRTLCTELGLLPDRLSYGFASVPPQAQLFYVHESHISDLLTRTLKNSDNLYAEAIFYQIAHLNAGANATATDGARLIDNVIRKAGANSTFCEIHDGCGLSPYDFLTPATLVAMLRYAYRNANIYYSLIEALPISGKDGTLSSRMKTGPAYLNVHAKTGTVTGVSSLAGYVTASNGHTLAFAIINNGLLKTTTGHNIQDKICQELAR